MLTVSNPAATSPSLAVAASNVASAEPPLRRRRRLMDTHVAVDTAPFWMPGFTLFLITLICALINLGMPSNKGLMVCTCIFNSLMAAMAIIYAFVFLIGGIAIQAGGGLFAAIIPVSSGICNPAALLNVLHGLGVGLIGGSFIYIFAAVCCIGAASASCASSQGDGSALLGEKNLGGVTMVAPDLRHAKAPKGGPTPAMGPGIIVATDKANFTNI